MTPEMSPGQIEALAKSAGPGYIHLSQEEYLEWCKSGKYLPVGTYIKVANTAMPESSTNPLDIQISGDHYKSLPIQPVEYIHANKIPFIEGCVIKYVSRWRSKGGLKDLEKAKHFIDLLIELETRSSPKDSNPAKSQSCKLSSYSAIFLNESIYYEHRKHSGFRSFQPRLPAGRYAG